MNKLNKSILNIFNLNMVFVLIGVISLIATSFNSYFWFDDFWIRKDLLENNFWEYTLNNYLLWDGRSFSPIYMFRNYLLFLFDYNFVYIPILLSLCSLILSGYIISEILSSISQKNISKRNVFLFTFLLSFCLWLCFRPHLSRSVYWVTGSFYNYSNLMFLILIYFFIKNPNKILFISFLIPLSVLSGVNNGISWMVFLVLYFFIFKKVISFKLFLTFSIITIISLCVNVFAPGNFIRAGDMINFNFISMVEGFFTVFKEYLFMSIWVFLSALFISIIWPSEIKFQISNKLFIIFFIASISSIIPFIVIPESASKHTSIFFQTLLFISFVILFKILINMSKINFYLKYKKIILFSFLIYFNYTVLVQFIYGRDVKNQVNQRMLILEDKKNYKEVIFLNTIRFQEKNFTNRSWDIVDNSNNENNVSYQRYFNTGPIKIKKCLIQ